MGFLALVSSAFSAIGSWFGLQNKQQERYNAPDMTANKDAARDQAEKEKLQADIAKANKTKNLDQERKDFAE